MIPVLILAAGAAAFYFSSKKSSSKSEDEDKPVATLGYTDAEFFKYDDLFKKYGTKYGVNWQWLKAIAMNESRLGKESSVIKGGASYDGLSWGLMQIAPSRLDLRNLGYKDGLGPKDLNRPEISIEVAAKLLKELNSHFQGKTEWVIKGYNEGEGNARKEMNGKGGGFATAYWKKFQENFTQVSKRVR